MFYYYGRKKALAGRYPEPSASLIVEPFAGAAAYSLHGERWRNEVVLIERDERIAELWDWLIKASPSMISALPDPRPGDRLDELGLGGPELLLLRLHCCPGKTRDHLVAARRGRWGPGRRYVMDTLEKVRHWTVIHGDYTEAPDEDATWFIDPPYQGRAGRHYRHHEIDYPALASWVRGRRGQVIACDQADADWLPFTGLRNHVSTNGNVKVEAMWHAYNGAPVPALELA